MLPREDNKGQMKTCSLSLAFRATPITTTASVSGWLQKKADHNEHWGGWGMVQLLWKGGWSLMELNRHYKQPSNLSPRYLPKWNEGLCSHENSVNIHCNLISNFITQRNRNSAGPRNHVDDSPACCTNCKQPERKATDCMTPLIPHTGKGKITEVHAKVKGGRDLTTKRHMRKHSGGQQNSYFLTGGGYTTLFVKTHGTTDQRGNSTELNKCKPTNK